MKRVNKKPGQGPDLTRRRVLGSAFGVGTAASLGLLSMKGVATIESAPDPDAESRNYRESDHIRRYYKSARL